jgi:hypothetical protein
MDRAHGLPPWAALFQISILLLNMIRVFNLKKYLVILKHTFVLSSKPHLHPSVFFILKRGLLTTYHDKSMHHVNNNSVTDLQSRSMITAYEIKETTFIDCAS